MKRTAVQRSAALPLYYQIFSSLRDQILSGALPYGAGVPTEQEISQHFEVSRITARRAMHELAESGLVERRRRIGTKVIYRDPREKGSDGRSRTIDSLIAFGRETTVAMLEFGIVAASAEAAAALELDEGDEIVHAVRLREFRDVPLGLIESVLPVTELAWISEEKLREEPLLELLRRSGKKISAGKQVIAAVAATPEISTLLQLEPRAPVMRVERVLRADEGRPVARTVAQYRGDRFRLELDLEAVPHPLVQG
jgi:GntR family transcriptional regulator